MPKTHLTQLFVNNGICPEGKTKVDHFDDQTKGLMLEVRNTGGKTYYLRHQDIRGKARQSRLADTKDVTLSQARDLADKYRSKIAIGIDPREEKATAKAVPTFKSFIEEQYLPFVQSYKRSWSTDVSILKNHLLPRFANRYLDTLTRQDISQMLVERKKDGAAPGSVNRLLIMMRYIFNLALKWEVTGVKSNPTKGVPLLEENNKKERYLSQEEAARLFEAVCNSDAPMLQYIVPMLILTGARKREVLDAKWTDFDLVNRRWRIPMTKTGKARHVPLADGALHVLTTIPHLKDCPWVFANPDTGKPFVSIFCSWNSARTKAGLADVRIHDLRHSFASLLVNNGRTLYEVQRLLGHTQVKTTQRYAHLSQDTLLDAANTATRALGQFMMPLVSSQNQTQQLMTY